MERKAYLKLATLAEAKKTVFGKFQKSPLDVEKVHLTEAQGRTLAENAVARISSPAYHGAAMDGVAIAAEITFGASERRPKTFYIGQEAHWVNTGNPLPSDCNCVIMVENVVAKRTSDGHETITIEKAAFPWQHVRKLGEDMVATEILLPVGTLIGPYELGAMAASGLLEPVVYKKPKVVIIPSGSELVPLEEATPELLASGEKLPEFNSLMLSALVREVGGDPRVMPIVPDVPEKIRDVILAAVRSDADLVVVNAGSSAGSRDYTAEIVSELGELWIHGLTIMPGKPTVIGGVEGKPVLGIPGYPVSATIAFEQFAMPLLARWQDRTEPYRPTAMAMPVQDLPSRAGMEEFIRVKLGRVDNKLLAVPLPRGAGAVSSLSRADGMIRIPSKTEGIPADKPMEVTFLRSPDSVDGALLAIGSHDNTLDLLDSLLRKHKPGHSLTSAHVGSLGGLMAIKAGRCHLAGSHLLGPDGVYNQKAIAEHLAGIPVHLVRLVDREQGLIVKPGNPDNIKTLSDLARDGVVFINRQRGSGTRVLLDWELKRLGIDEAKIEGYENEEYTHMNVAAAVLSDRATVGLGVKSAAVALGLDFVPVGVEEYDLVIPDRFWSTPSVKALIEVIRSRTFKNAAREMGGYGVDKTGKVIWTFEG